MFATRAPMHKNTAWRTSLWDRNGICQTADDAERS
jgi:hypothetical protein